MDCRLLAGADLGTPIVQLFVVADDRRAGRLVAVPRRFAAVGNFLDMGRAE